MTEKTEAKNTIGDMVVEEFAALLLTIVERAQKVDSKGKRRIVDLTAEEFTQEIVQSVKNGSLRTAAAESEVANRILLDWTALMNVAAVTQPFRVKTVKDVHAMATNLSEQLVKSARPGVLSTAKGVEYVVVVAVAHPDGTYSEYSGG